MKQEMLAAVIVNLPFLLPQDFDRLSEEEQGKRLLAIVQVTFDTTKGYEEYMALLLDNPLRLPAGATCTIGGGKGDATIQLDTPAVAAETKFPLLIWQKGAYFLLATKGMTGWIDFGGGDRRNISRNSLAKYARPIHNPYREGVPTGPEDTVYAVHLAKTTTALVCVGGHSLMISFEDPFAGTDFTVALDGAVPPLPASEMAARDKLAAKQPEAAKSDPPVEGTECHQP
jgi:hypothetical protein